jgi:hypothetical protein
MTTRKRALHEITLAVARAAAATHPKFAEALGTELRERLARMSAREKTFSEALQWLERFEGEVSGKDSGDREKSRGHLAAGTPELRRGGPTAL